MVLTPGRASSFTFADQWLYTVGALISMGSLRTTIEALGMAALAGTKAWASGAAANAAAYRSFIGGAYKPSAYSRGAFAVDSQCSSSARERGSAWHRCEGPRGGHDDDPLLRARERLRTRCDARGVGAIRAIRAVRAGSARRRVQNAYQQGTLLYRIRRGTETRDPSSAGGHALTSSSSSGRSVHASASSSHS